MFRGLIPRELAVYIHHFACVEFCSLEYSLKALDRMVCADIYIFSLIYLHFIYLTSCSITFFSSRSILYWMLDINRTHGYVVDAAHVRSYDDTEMQYKKNIVPISQ